MTLNIIFSVVVESFYAMTHFLMCESWVLPSIGREPMLVRDAHGFWLLASTKGYG